jgi:hypothetical protein
MIYQISHIQNKTQDLSHLNKGLLQARHIQARLKESAHHAQSSLRHAATADFSLLPVNSWFD